MTDVEKRLAAVELLMIELMASIDDRVVRKAEKSIRRGLIGVSPEEKAVRVHALQLLREGSERNDPPPITILYRNLANDR